MYQIKKIEMADFLPLTVFITAPMSLQAIMDVIELLHHVKA